MNKKLKNIAAKLWRVECGMHLLFATLLLPAFYDSLHMPFALNNDYGQMYAAETDVHSPINWVAAGTLPGGDQNWYIYYNYLRRKVFTQVYDFNEIKAAIPYAEDQRELPFVVLPDDLIGVEMLAMTPITKEMRVFVILAQSPEWRETLVFHSNVVTNGNSAHLFNISACRMEKATLTWRNWSAEAILPATRIIVRVWRQTVDRGQIGSSPNLPQKK